MQNINMGNLWYGIWNDRDVLIKEGIRWKGDDSLSTEGLYQRLKEYFDNHVPVLIEECRQNGGSGVGEWEHAVATNSIVIDNCKHYIEEQEALPEEKRNKERMERYKKEVAARERSDMRYKKQLEQYYKLVEMQKELQEAVNNDELANRWWYDI